MQLKILSRIKNSLVPAGRGPKTIVAGPFNGIRMNLDLQTESQIWTGLFEAELHGPLRRFSSGIRSLVDIGAAHGEYTLYGLMKTRAERIITFEPNPNILVQLRRNLRLNGVEHDSRLDLHTKFLTGAEGPDSMDASDLADMIISPCLIKMDIDGGETAVLRAASKRLLALSGVRWVIETHSAELERECISILQSSGYSTTVIPNAWWRFFLPEQRPVEQNRWLLATR